jgi:hypothetical protein
MKAILAIAALALAGCKAPDPDAPSEPSRFSEFRENVRGKLAGSVGFRIGGGEAALYFKYGEVFTSDQAYIDSQDTK